MSPKLIGALAVVTLVTTLAAVAVAIGQPDVAPARVIDEPAFPALREQPNAVEQAVIKTPEDQITLVREGPERWVTPERQGYPVSAEAIRALIVGLADMRLIEPKTSRPDRYERLELQDVDADGAKSRLVRLEDADGNVLAEAILGKQRQRLTGLQPSGIYLRRPGEEQTWLASGGLELQATVQDWLETTIVDLEAGNLRHIEVRPQGGAGYALVRKGEGEPLALQDLAEGEQQKKDAELQRLAQTFSGLELSDVKPADQLSWPEEVNSVALETFEGLELEARLALIEDQPWLEIERVDGPAASTVGAAEEPVETEPGEPEQSASGEAEAAETSDAGGQVETAEEKSPPDPQAIAERTRGWAYQISRSVYDRLTQPRNAWLQGAKESS